MEPGNLMDKEAEKFRLLLQKYNEGLCTSEEMAWLESWYLQWNESRKESMSRAALDETTEEMWNVVSAQTTEVPVYKLWPRIAAAAVVLLTVGAALVFFQNRSETEKVDSLAQESYKQDIQPGGIKATLTLADGRKIVLDGAKNGVLAKQTGIKITKTADGQLIYTIADSKSASPSAYNTIETPKGGQYQIRLPDGTQVWLNSGSSMKYPLSFAGSRQRRVELNGEAYFEVAPNKKSPFIVKTAKQEVEVLGTHFDINAYPDEQLTKTTLLEGSVKLNGRTRLIPGEQGISAGDRDIQVKQVNTDEVMDWKNKQFIFNEEELQSVMRRISRWYDVDIVYEDKPQDLKFVGVISSTRNVSGVLKLMERTKKVHFKIEGRKIIVLSKQ